MIYHSKIQLTPHWWNKHRNCFALIMWRPWKLPFASGFLDYVSHRSWSWHSHRLVQLDERSKCKVWTSCFIQTGLLMVGAQWLKNGQQNSPRPRNRNFCDIVSIQFFLISGLLLESSGKKRRTEVSIRLACVLGQAISRADLG